MKHYKSTVYYYWVHGSPPLHTFKLLFLEVRWSDRNNQICVSSSEIVCVSSFFLSLSFFSFSFQDFWEKLNSKEGDPLPRFHLLRVFFQRLWHSLPAFRCCWTAQFPHAVSQAFLKADSLCRNLLEKKKILMQGEAACKLWSPAGTQRGEKPASESRPSQQLDKNQ